MANYNLVIDTSNFKPYNITPYLLAMHDYRDAYYKDLELLDKIAEEKGLYIPPEGTKYRDIRDKYDLDFEALVDRYNKGMDWNDRAAVNKLRQRYLTEIAPINKAAEAYNKYLDKLTALGPDAIIGNKSTFEDFYGGNNPAIDYRSAKQVELDSMKYFSGINNALTQDPNFKDILDEQYYLQTQKGGLDGGDALKAALVDYNNRTNGQHSKEIQELLGHMQRVMDAEAVDNFSDDAKRQVWNKIASGLVASIEAPKYTNVTNRDHETDGERASREYTELQRDYYKDLKSLEEEEKNLKLGKIKVDDGGGKYHYEYNPQKAKEILDLRRASQEDNPTKVTPHITYGGHRYSVKKVSDIGKGLDTYEVSDIDTGEIITDASLKQGIVDYYNGKSAPSTEVPSTPSQPAGSKSATLKKDWTGD